MSFPISNQNNIRNQTLAIVDKITDLSYLPQQSLFYIFFAVTQQCEKIAGHTFDDSLKMKVWKKLSSEEINKLNKVFLWESARLMFKFFFRGFEFSKASVQFEEALSEIVMEEAVFLTRDWIPKIVEAYGKRGISFF